MSTTSAAPTRPQSSGVTGIDPRGPQFTAAITTVVLLASLLAGPGPVALVLVAVQTVMFAIGSTRGVQHTPIAWAFRTWVRPRLAAPDHLEDPAPPRFAQTVGLGFSVAALLGLVTGLDALTYAALGLALVAALLNAVFRFCLGCELFLLYKRATA